MKEKQSDESKCFVSKFKYQMIFHIGFFILINHGKKKMSLESERIKLKSLPPTSLHQLNKSFQCFLIDFQQVILQR